MLYHLEIKQSNIEFDISYMLDFENFNNIGLSGKNIESVEIIVEFLPLGI